MGAAACAQRGAFLQELINGDLNPCGAGVRPTSCTCADGTTISKRGDFLGSGLKGPCGDCSPPTTCTCPDGTEAAMPSRNDVKERLKSRVLNSPNNPCGSGVSVSCTCGDGSTFTPGSTTSSAGNDQGTLAAVAGLLASVPTDNRSAPVS